MNGAARLIVALLAITTASPPPPTAVAPSQPAKTLPVTIAFELANRHVLVQARINGSRPLWFVLDTGANIAIVRMATAIELGLTLEGRVNTGGAGAGTQAGRLVKGASWSLAGLDGFSQRVSLALPFPELPSGLGHDIDGIVGGEFIQQFVLTLDYQARTVTLHDPRTFTYHGGGQTVPLDFTPNRHPVVSATVTPRDGTPIAHRFMLDIGSGGALILHSPFVAEHKLLNTAHQTVRAVGAIGAGGRVHARIGRVAALQIGMFTLRDPTTMFAEDKAGAFADPTLAGNIGAQVAARFRLTFEYGRKRLILEPSPEFTDPFERPVTGLAIRAEGADYRTFRVREILEDSAATEAGIEVGDVITAVDGIDASALTLRAINDRLETPGTHDVSIRRGDLSIKVRLTPRKLA